MKVERSKRFAKPWTEVCIQKNYSCFRYVVGHQESQVYLANKNQLLNKKCIKNLQRRWVCACT